MPFRTSCWNCARSMSVPANWPEPQVFSRVRASVSASSAFRVCVPLSSFRVKPPFASPPEISEQTFSGRSTSTPPIESMKSRKPLKSTIATWSIVDAEELLERLHGQLGAAEGVGGVDLLPALPGDRRQGVAGDRELAERRAPGAHQQDRVRAVGQAGLGGRLAPARGVHAFRRRRLALGGQARRPDVGAEDEDRLRADRQERVAVEHVVDAPVELRALDLRGDREQDDAEEDPPRRRDPDPFEDAPPGRLRRPRQLRLGGPALLRLLGGAAEAVAKARNVGRAPPGKEPAA